MDSKHLIRSTLAACAVACSACGDDSDGTTLDGGTQTPSVMDSAVPGGGGDAGMPSADGGSTTLTSGIGSSAPTDDGDHVYALHYSVVTEGDNRISYVYLSKTLDLPPRVEIQQSREFYGYANSITMNGYLLMSEEGSIMKKYAISSELKWSEAGQISFANYADLEDVGFWRQAVAGPHSAFLLHNVTDRLVWDPTDFKIVRDVTGTQLALKRDGMDLNFSANRDPAPHTPWKGPILRSFQYEGENASGEWVTSPDSLVVRYEPESYAEAAVYNVPCPSLQIATQDDQGNTYYSDWAYDAHRSLWGLQPRPCIAKFDASGAYDPSFTTDFSMLTGGRIVGTFRYVRDGKALATVLHHEEVTADFTQPLTDAIVDELRKHWYLWIFDLNAKTARQTSLTQPINSGFMAAEFGERYFLFPIPWEPTGEVQNYEAKIDGTITPSFKTPGFAYTLVQVR